MSDTLATEKVPCPCCKGAKILAVYDCDGYTQIGNVACCYCVATGYIHTEPQGEKTVTEIFAKAGPTIASLAHAGGWISDEEERARREFQVQAQAHTIANQAKRIASLNRKLAKGKKAAALIRSRKAKGVPRKKKRGR